MSIAAMWQGVCDLDRSLKVSAPPTKFSKCSHNLQPFFCPNNSFQMKKNDALRRSFDWKLTSPNMSKDSQKHVWSVHVTGIYCSDGKNLREFEVSFSSHKISLWSKSPHFDGATFEQLATTLVGFIWQKCMCNESVVFAFRKERLYVVV